MDKRLKEFGRTKWDMGDRIDSLTEASWWLRSQVLPITPMGLKKLLKEIYGKSVPTFSREFMQELKIVMILRVLHISREEIHRYLDLSKQFRQKKMDLARREEFKNLIKDIIWAKGNVKEAFEVLDVHLEPEKEFLNKLSKQEEKLLRK